MPTHILRPKELAGASAGRAVIATDSSTIAGATSPFYENVADGQVLIRFAIWETSFERARCNLRVVDGNNYYTVQYTSASGALQLGRFLDNTFSSLEVGSAFSVVPGRIYCIRAEVEGIAIRGRIWEDGTEEPETWVETTDANFSQGRLGWAARLAMIDSVGLARAGKTAPLHWGEVDGDSDKFFDDFTRQPLGSSRSQWAHWNAQGGDPESDDCRALVRNWPGALESLWASADYRVEQYPGLAIHAAGCVIEQVDTDNARRVLVHPEASSDDIEVVALLWLSEDGANRGRVHICAHGSGGSERGYMTDFHNGAFNVAKYSTTGSFTVLAGEASVVQTGVWLAVRFRLEHDHLEEEVILRAKTWNIEAEEEPASWTVETDDPDYYDVSGKWGVGWFNPSGTQQFGYIAAAIGGGTAPLDRVTVAGHTRVDGIPRSRRVAVLRRADMHLMALRSAAIDGSFEVVGLDRDDYVVLTLPEVDAEPDRNAAIADRPFFAPVGDG